MHPAAGDHRCDDLDRLELLGRAHERVAREYDEIGEVAGEQLAAATLVTREPRGIDAGRDERLLDRQALLGMPRRAVVDRPEHPGANPGERIELLDGRVRTVDDQGAGAHSERNA